MNLDQSGIDAAGAEKIIIDFIGNSPKNTLENEDNDPAFETPLIGFSRGNDPLYEAFKQHVGPFHLTPLELFTLTFRDADVNPEELSVISWILPHNPLTRIDNRKKTDYPSERWARGRIFGEKTNEALRKHVVDTLAKQGYRAVAPALTPQFSVRLSPTYGYASTWSERHAAFASGLGTFGLCDGLITSAGKAMRTGSVIAQISTAPTDRPYTHHKEYCLYFSKGICGKCISRCPVGAISETGKDKTICYRHLIPNTRDYVKSHYAFDGYGCGLCQTKVPCEAKIPKARDVN